LLIRTVTYKTLIYIQFPEIALGKGIPVTSSGQMCGFGKLEDVFGSALVQKKYLCPVRIGQRIKIGCCAKYRYAFWPLVECKVPYALQVYNHVQLSIDRNRQLQPSPSTK
jgi:hypothetical protein